MSTSGTGATPATPGPPPGVTAPAGVVTLTVGDTGRASSSRSKRPGPGRAAAAKAGGQPAAASSSPPAKPTSQWSVRWSADGPGPLLPSAEAEAEPDLTLTIGTDDARRIMKGELDPSVAFMQGKLKSTGNNALMLSILAWSATPAFSKALAEWSAGATS